MQPYYELAYALASGSLCFFVGTGFSKHVTGGVAPDWMSLLKDCCAEVSGGDNLIEELFPDDKPIMPLEECASVIDLQMQKEDKSLYQVIARRLRKLDAEPKKVVKISEFATKHASLKFITTNYDRLIEDSVLKSNCTEFCPGFPITRQRTANEVYHVHGGINAPQDMVVTANDYYRFINQPSYFAKRLDTLIAENTTVIIGYSLGDINFKSILNAHRFSSSHEVNRQHLFFLSRKSVPQHVKDYYDSSYGLRVIENTEIDELVAGVDIKYDQIVYDVKAAKDQLNRILAGKHKYTDDYLKKRESFAKILATLSSTGIRITDQNVIDFLKGTIQRKHAFTNENGTWEQYDHLADWLVQLGCVMDLEGTALEQQYLEAVSTSFQSMSKTKQYGKSWDAYKTWRSDWGLLTFKNRAMVRRHVDKKGLAGDFSTFIHV